MQALWIKLDGASFSVALRILVLKLSSPEYFANLMAVVTLPFGIQWHVSS